MTLASQLTERVRIEKPTASDDGFGGQNVVWSELATVFASVLSFNTYARERTLGEQNVSVAGYRVRIRVRDDVDASMRVIWKNRTLAIHALHETSTVLELLTYEEHL